MGDQSFIIKTLVRLRLFRAKCICMDVPGPKDKAPEKPGKVSCGQQTGYSHSVGCSCAHIGGRYIATSMAGYGEEPLDCHGTEEGIMVKAQLPEGLPLTVRDSSCISQR